MSVLENKKIVLAVCAGVAIYKSLELLRLFKKADADVQVLMTKNAEKLVSPQLFAVLSGNQVASTMFGPGAKSGIFQPEMDHIGSVKNADVMVFCPATANMLAKLAHGYADDLVSTASLAYQGPKLLCPAMNEQMYANSIVQENLHKLRKHGYEIVEPEAGEMVCGSHGIGRLADIERIFWRAEKSLTSQDLAGKKVLITAGPTLEKIDPVRYISNFSSGKMGYALAREAGLRGAKVSLISGPSSEKAPFEVELIPVNSTDEMQEAVEKYIDTYDVFISAAAVSDFRPHRSLAGKMKKDDLYKSEVLREKSADQKNFLLQLEVNPDILGAIGTRKFPQGRRPFLVGFALETENLKVEALRKMREKKLDMIVANGPENLGADLKEGVIFDKKGNSIRILKQEASSAAQEIWNQIVHRK